MDFYLELHNGECGLDGHFCDQQRDHGPSVLIQPVRSNIMMLGRLRNIILNAVLRCNMILSEVMTTNGTGSSTRSDES